MKDLKNRQVSACGWGHWHELLGLILIVIATLLTLATMNGLGIFMMFFVGGLLCCYRHLSCCHVDDNHDYHCHITDTNETVVVHKDTRPAVRKAPAKPKK